MAYSKPLTTPDPQIQYPKVYSVKQFEALGDKHWKLCLSKHINTKSEGGPRSMHLCGFVPEVSWAVKFQVPWFNKGPVRV